MPLENTLRVFKIGWILQPPPICLRHLRDWGIHKGICSTHEDGRA